MKKRTVMIALALVLIGITLFVAGGCAMGFDFKQMNNRNYTERTEEFTDTFENITLDGGYIRILPSADGKCRAVITECEGIRYASGIEDGTLSIRRSDERKWYEYIGFSFGECGVELHLPEADYNTLKIHTGSGSIDVAEGLSFHHVNIEAASGSVRFRASVNDKLFAECTSGSMDIRGTNARGISLSMSSGSLKLADMEAAGDISISTSSGSISAENINCSNMDIRITSGRTKLDSVIASGAVNIKSTSGSITFDGCDANAFRIESTSGSIGGTLLSGKLFDARATSGSVNVPPSVEGSGTFSAVATSGSIKISIE